MTLLGAATFAISACAGLILVSQSAIRMRHGGIHWAFTCLLSLCFAIAMFSYSDPLNRFEDLKTAYYPAGAAVLESRAALEPVLLQGIDGFVNLPILAYLFAPFGMLSSRWSSASFLVCGIAAIVVTCWLLIRITALDRVRASQFTFMMASWAPLHYSLREANTSHILMLFLVLALLLVRQRREYAGGALLALIALIKPPLIALGGYQPLIGRWRVAVSGFVIIVSGIALSLAVFGLPMHVAWLETTILPFGKDPMAAFNVQSLDGWLARLEGTPDSLLDWRVVALSPDAALLSKLGKGLMALVTLAVAVRASARPGWAEHRDEWTLCLGLLLVCTLSPLSWSHYHVWSLIPLAYCLKFSEARPGVLRWTVYAAAILSVPPVTRWQELGAIEGLYTYGLSSHIFLGALLLWGALLWNIFRGTTLQEASAAGLSSPPPQPPPGPAGTR